ncbi:potassium channel family protein [Demequina muriae]|uniref:Potassium channel family protein n=1 Tax=Demequina muriae TaxID=3051664 RepID=A0ABT8GJE4_9MICO|nr:potassium channel family protein [Demequina sp. EGI L300058]MDN4481553.1 potassium channel family protein [Demequina sp. EGI L300058]
MTPAPDPGATSGDASGDHRRRHPLERRSAVWLLLASLVLIQFAYPITDGGDGWMAVYLLLYVGVIAFAIRVALAHPRRYGVFVPLSVLMVIGGAWFVVSPDSDHALSAMLAGIGLLQLGLLAVLIFALLEPPERANGIDLLLMAVCGFLMMGGVFGAAAALIEIASPGSFADPTITVVPLPWQSLLYGSFVTLSALGFGDVTPVSAWARSLFSFEGVIGVLFIAVVVSRLVSVAGKAIDSEE